MEIKNKDLKNLHDVELEIFNEFTTVCKKMNLKYFFLGGSVLGAVRHQGFIPWDDDIDVGMPRKDYEKFINEGQKYLSENLFIQTMKTDKNYRNHFAKIRKNGTTFIEEKIKNVKMNHGIYIDIFPLDGIGNTLEEAQKNHHHYRKLHLIYLLKKKDFPTKGLRNKIRYLYYFTLSLQYKNIYKIEEKIQKYCSTLDYDDCKYVCNFFGMWEAKEIAVKDWFSKGIKAKYENVEVVIPKDTDSYLKALYGDYMKLPPKEKRKMPHCYILDLKNNYDKYIK